jgi:hypothetical protein
MFWEKIMTEISQEYLAGIAKGIWLAGAKKRKFALWRNELSKLFKKIEAKLDLQEETLIKSIRAGILPAEVFVDCETKIENARADIDPWIIQIGAWTGGSDIDIEEKVESFEDVANKAEIKIKAQKAKKVKK